MFKELFLSSLIRTTIFDEQLFLLLSLKLPGLGCHRLLLLGNLQGLLSVEQDPLSSCLPELEIMSRMISHRQLQPVKHVVCIGPVQLAAGGEGLVQLYEGRRPVTRTNTKQPTSLVDLDAVEGGVRHLDVEDGDLVVVEEVPHLNVPVHPCREEHRDLGWAPTSSSQSRDAWLHPHNGRRLQVLAPDLAGGVANREEVLGVERIPEVSSLNK